MGSCDRRRTSIDPRRGLYAGVALIGMGLSLVAGQGVAVAAPSESSGSSQSSESAETTESPAVSNATDASVHSAEGADGRSSETPSDTGSDPDGAADAPDVDELADLDEETDLAESDDPGESADLDDMTDLDPATGLYPASELKHSTRAAATEAADVDSATSPDAGSKRSRADGAGPREPGGSPGPVRLDDSATDARDAPNGAARQSYSDVVETPTTGVPVVGSDVKSALSPPAPAATPLAASAVARGAPTLRGLVSARPVTANSIVTDLLTWVGLGPPANGLPAPAAPVSALMQSLWLAVRQAQYTLNNQRPAAEATMSGPGPDGVVSGSLNAVDYDDVVLTYRVAAAPTRGTVVIDALGNFTYTPHDGALLTGDRFVITVDDTAGNPFHVHGLRGLLGVSSPTEVAVVIGPAAARRDGPAAIDLGDLLSRNGVEVTIDSDGTVGVIDGRFTDHAVSSAVDAAAVINALAPVLGVSAGFADPAAITNELAGVGSSAESFYRLGESIDGIDVLGSEIILVTDSEGAVTGLFNNYRGLADGFDVTPADMVDEDAEVHLIAGAAYLGAGADRDALEMFLAKNTFSSRLIVYALDDDAAPSLSWRVVVQFPDTGGMSPPGVTYLIHADGPDAGTVLVTMSNVADASAVTVATDWLGDDRTITVDSSEFLFLTTTKLVDATRGITTYRAFAPFFGYFGSFLPGTVVKRGWLGWDKGAVSAHANTAVVYDYYRDVLGRTSFDGAGAPIRISIRYNPDIPIFGYANAFWDPNIQQFAFGDRGYLQAALDVVAHEFTHGVVSHVVGGGGSVLDYGESGALNEAYADILGALIEGKAGRDRWLIAEDSAHGVFRDLANPGSTRTPQGPYRSHYDTRYTGRGDEGGEHVNSTIFSHAAYKMMTSVATGEISDDTWATVFYQSLYRLSPGAVFIDGRAAVLSTATALGFTPEELDAIRDAFDSVGILEAAPSAAVAA